MTSNLNIPTAACNIISNVSQLDIRESAITSTSSEHRMLNVATRSNEINELIIICWDFDDKWCYDR